MKPIPVRQISGEHAQQSNQGKFSIRSIGNLLNGERLIHPLHRHNFYLILAIKSGTGTHEIDFKSYPVAASSLFILKPGQVHRLELNRNCKGFIIEFDPAFYQPQNLHISELWKLAAGKNYCKVNSSKFKALYSTLNDVLQEFTKRDESYFEAIKALLDLFFIKYMRVANSAGNSGSKTNEYTNQRFDDLHLLIEQNISQLKTVAEYAALMHLSPFQLNNITRSAIGKKVSELINDQIILEAKRYLLGTSTQVKEIAALLGYEDTSYFIRFFKKHTGYSPDRFRKDFK